jgi:hypothetical protein
MFPVAQHAFDLAKRWFDGERLDPDQFEDAIHDDRDTGVDICAQHAKSEPEISAWLALESALLYVAFHAYRSVGQQPTPLVSEVEEDELDTLEKCLRAISPASIDTVLRAATFLAQDGRLSFAHLKTAIGKT